MPYTYKTSRYQLPYMGDGDVLNESDERYTARVIENQLRGGILAAGGNRVLSEGDYTVDTDAAGVTTVTLFGNPALQGFANEGFVEVQGSLVWGNLVANSIYYLHVRVSSETYYDPGAVEAIVSNVPISSNDYLFLASVDTTDATTETPPTVNTAPEGKASAFNLNKLLNTNYDPFGPVLSQSALIVLQQMTVRLGKDKTALFQQLNTDATLPVISIENNSNQPEVKSANELRFADVRITNGFAFTDDANQAYIGTAVSIIGALNETLAGLRAHIDDSDDPHGPTLTQTRIVLRESLTLPQIIIDAPPPGPPGPPGSPPTSPPIDELCNIKSKRELKFCDIRSHIYLSEEGEETFNGSSISIIGALNELLSYYGDLDNLLKILLGEEVPSRSPINLTIYPDDIGYPLHFKLVFYETTDLEDPVLTKESKESNEGWYYEFQEPAPAASTTTRPPNALPGKIDVPAKAPEPFWKPLPVTGIPGADQLMYDGRYPKVQYRPKNEDGLYTRRPYVVLMEQFNTEYGDTEITNLVLG